MCMYINDILYHGIKPTKENVDYQSKSMNESAEHNGISSKAADRIKEWPRNERKVRKSQAKPNLILKSISKTNPCVSNQRESCFSRILKIFCKILPLNLEVFQFHFSFSILRNFHFTFPFSKNENWWKPLASNCK